MASKGQTVVLKLCLAKVMPSPLFRRHSLLFMHAIKLVSTLQGDDSGTNPSTRLQQWAPIPRFRSNIVCLGQEHKVSAQASPPIIYVMAETAKKRNTRKHSSVDRTTSQSIDVEHDPIRPVRSPSHHQLSRMATEAQQNIPRLGVEGTAWRDNNVYSDSEEDAQCDPTEPPQLYDDSRNMAHQSSIPWTSRRRGPGQHQVPAQSIMHAELPNNHEGHLLCLAFETILPHPTKGLLSRMLRLSPVRCSTSGCPPQPQLQLCASTDYLLTCTLRPSLPDAPVSHALQLHIWTADKKENPVQLEKREPSDEGSWIACGTWRSPDMPSSAGNTNKTCITFNGKATITTLPTSQSAPPVAVGEASFTFDALLTR